jgi:hypothetical protein
MMTCSTKNSCCNVCPGMWIAGALMLAMLFQALFIRPSAPKPSDLESGNKTQETNVSALVSRAQSRQP